MSAKLSCQNTESDVPQPVKKRGRFSSRTPTLPSQFEHQVSELQTDNNPVPHLFVREELDEYDSADDEDYEARVADDEYMLDEDDQEEFEFIDEFKEAPHTTTKSHHNHPPSSENMTTIVHQENIPTSTSVFSQQTSSLVQLPSEHTPDLSSIQFSHTAPISHYEVDDLDSTDDDEDEDESYDTDHLDTNWPTNRLARRFQREVLDEESEDEHDIDVDDSSDDDDDDDEDTIKNTQRNDYEKFLQELVTEEPSDPKETMNPSTENNMHPDSRPSDAEARETITRILDEDDDDFDYLKELANIKEDPLEYRHDFHVPRKEVVQLLFTDSRLRPQTRTLKPRKTSLEKTIVPHTRPITPSASVNATQIGPSNIISQQPKTIVHHQLPKSSTLAPQLVPNTDSITQAQNQVSSIPKLPAFQAISTIQLNQFKNQLTAFTQILTHVHADATRKIKTKEEEDQEEESTIEENKSTCDSDMNDLKEASKKSESLLKRLVENKKISIGYHEMISRQMKGLKPFSSQFISGNEQKLIDCENCRKSVYDIEWIDLIEPFLESCNKKYSSRFCIWESLKPFKSFKLEWIDESLNKKRIRRQYSTSGIRNGWFVWTAEDDNLLALTISKYGREVGNNYKDLLPHREEEDCETRVRYLSSRRCADNAVKRQIIHLSSPLRKEELKLVEYGLQKYKERNENNNDEQVWKCIQRNLLPHRDWSHLQKLWAWREAKRKYKARYRSKVRAKKLAMKEKSIS